MIDFPLDGLRDEPACLQWLEAHLHPDGLRCPRCGQAERRARPQGRIPSLRCRGCDRYYPALTGTAFEKTRQAPATLLRGVARGEPTARLSRELNIRRKQANTPRHRVQGSLYETLPTHALAEPPLEADELYQNAWEKRAAPQGLAGPRPGTGPTGGGGTAPTPLTARRSSRWRAGRPGRCATSCASTPTPTPASVS
ncbi:MAG: hypothetical protein JO250_17390 [Armatimonadetes bacterium]|nr:hypothetical protein [Armatimonadota bacterium]